MPVAFMIAMTVCLMPVAIWLTVAQCQVADRKLGWYCSVVTLILQAGICLWLRDYYCRDPFTFFLLSTMGQCLVLFHVVTARDLQKQSKLPVGRGLVIPACVSSVLYTAVCWMIAFPVLRRFLY